MLPYLCQKLPTQIDMRTTRAIHLNILSPDQFAEIETLANTTESPDDDGFNMTLIAAAPVAETTEQGRESPAEQRAVIERNDRERPVTPSVAADSPGGLKSADAWWDSLATGRRQPLDASAQAPGRSSWERLDRHWLFRANAGQAQVGG